MDELSQTQLPLGYDGDRADEWRLDAHTREAGRRGLAEARAALAAATQRAADRDAQTRGRRRAA